MDQQSAMEEIALIRRVIDESRRFAFENGKYYLLWGVLVTAAIFLEYAAVLTGRDHFSLWIWIITIGLGWVASMILGIREPSKHHSFPVGAKFTALIWSSAGISMMIIGFVGPITGALRGWGICPALAAVMGGAYVVSSLVYRLKWVAMVGIAWWIGSIAMFITGGIETLPVFGAMMILFQIVPGLVFYKTSRRSLAEAR